LHKKSSNSGKVRKEICENVILINAANQHTATNYYSNFMTLKKLIKTKIMF